jgi:cobalamin biosynthetic protein CobC
LRHGGRIDWARRAYPLAPQPWVDLSTGVNPSPWPGRRAGRAELARLPDPSAVAALEAAAAAAFGAEAAAVVATPGAEAALRLMPSLLQARSAAIVGPTYGGHAEAWRAAGASVRQITLDQATEVDAEVVVLVNPNNPDGVETPRARVLEIADRLAERNAWLVADESFVEVAPQLSIADRAGGRLVALRSFGKFYGLPGARLGFGIGDPELLARLRARLGDWPLSADALALGLGAYADSRWVRRTRARLASWSRRLDRALGAGGFEVVGGTDLFRLTRTPDADRRFAWLAERGVLTRPFAYDRQLIRFGLPRPSDWPRLTAALEDLSP